MKNAFPIFVAEKRFRMLLHHSSPKDKEKMTKRKTIRNTEDAARITREMAAQGYQPLAKSSTFTPAQFGKGRPAERDGGMRSFLDSNLYARCDGKDSPTRGRIPAVFAGSSCEQATPDKVGTKGLGYMTWGNDNLLPNRVAILTEMLPYMSASHKFNVDLVTGIGVEPTYYYTQYVGGNLSEKEIPYSSAGTLLKGWKLDILRELAKLDSEQQSSDSKQQSSDSEQQSSDSKQQSSGSKQSSDSKLSTIHSPLSTYRKALLDRLAEIEADLATWERVTAEVEDFFQRNNTLQTFLHLAADQVLLGMSFPEIDVQQTYIDPDTNHEVQTFKWRPKAVGIKFRSAMTSRLERMDDQNRINFVYLSNQWLNSSVYGNAVALKGSDTAVDAVRALDPSCPTESMKNILAATRRENVHRNRRPTRFILPTRIASPGRPYYPVPPHFSIFAGGIYDYAYTMIEDRATAKKNARVIGYVIYIHNDYLQQYYIQKKADDDNQKKAVRDQLFKEINTFLSDRDNHGKPLVAIQFRDADGKTAKAWEIVEIENDQKNTVEANERELQEISSIIFFSWAVDARLIGNSPGDVSSSGGTDLRERYLLKQIQMSSTQQLLLRPYYVVRDINDWDPRHLRFRIKREVLTTLDNSKTGITAAQDT